MVVTDPTKAMSQLDFMGRFSFTICEKKSVVKVTSQSQNFLP